jgi:hypothetical protein
MIPIMFHQENSFIVWRLFVFNEVLDCRDQLPANRGTAAMRAHPNDIWVQNAAPHK